MATLIVYPDAADLTVREHNNITEATFTGYLDKFVPNWDRDSTGKKIDSPKFVATLNGQIFIPQLWSRKVLLSSDLIEVVIPPKGTEIVGYIMAAIAAASAVYSVVKMNQMNTGSSTVPDTGNIYDVNVQANSAELMAVRPQWFGKHQSVPNYLCAPFKYFNESGDQQLCVMLHVGEGYYQVNDSDITIVNTPLTSLGDDVTWQVFEPGDDVSVHEAHKNIYTADEVGGTDSGVGLDFIGESYVVIDADDYEEATLSGNTILFEDGDFNDEDWETWPIDYDLEVGDKFTLMGTSSSALLFDGNIEISNSGVDETTGDPLPDILVGESINEKISVGQVVQLAGAGSNDGTYIIASATDSQLTLTDLDGNDVTGLTTTASVPVQIISTDSDDGLYQLTEIDSSDRLVVERVGMSDWTSFIGGFYGNAQLTLSVISDELPEYQIGPYVACPAGHVTDHIEIDMLRSNGWGYYNSSGSLKSLTVEWEVWVRDADLGFESEWEVYPFTYTGKSYDQLGETHVITLDAEIRPEVMIVRKTASRDDSSYLDEMQWLRLKSKLPTVTSYASSTTLAISINADSSLAGSATNKVKVLHTRKLPVPDGNGGWTDELSATRDIAPAVRFLIHDSGGDDDDIDMDALLALHNDKWSPNSEWFDGGFVDESTVYDVLKTKLQAGMAEFCFDLGKILPKRLEKKVSSGHVYTPDVMTGKGLTVTTTLYDPDEKQGLIVYYMDPVDWTTASVRCWIGDKNSITKWGELELTTGVISETRAWRIGMRALRRSLTEKVKYSFGTEMDALNSAYLDYADLCDDLPNFTQFGEVRDWQNVVNSDDDTVAQITVDRDLEWVEGDSHFMTIRRPDGTGNGAFLATQVADRVVQLDGLLDFIPNLAGEIEAPLWLFGSSDNFSEPAIITSITSNIDKDSTSCSVQAVNYSDSIFNDDENFPPDDSITWWE